MGMTRVFVSDRAALRRNGNGIVPVRNVRDLFERLFLDA
jgi:hypothetical protein